MLGRVLVANRGEIAVRVIRACRDLGITSVAVYSDADSEALHVELADESVPIGPAQAKNSYLDVAKVVEAARASGCDAVHPGYGFLSENPRLARACTDAGIAFVGPSAEVIERVGDKVSARVAARNATVPVVPGSDRLDDAEEALRYAKDVGFPVLLKAAAGGGGRGIRRVDADDELVGAFKEASREAQGAFGDGGLFVEKLIDPARHVEIQILADGEGNAVHLGERECSLQRRRQKLVEEAPAPGLPDQPRAELGAAAVRLAGEVGYVGAGTVEFLVDPRDWSFYFIEVNARIQVEHGVTELVTGVDLVAAQLRIAGGGTVGFAQEELDTRGTAIEFRINAEDPERGFFPSPGTLSLLRLPSGPGVRVDTGFETGKAIPPYYDSLLAKLMVWAPDRNTALARADRALSELTVEGVASTRDLHRRIVAWDDFRAATFTTTSLEHFLNPGS
ncbi:acetyl-CoA carboxylase biotin carboxylase subunit [Pseudonocardia spinosispora]|uniref:acetyl-CoA carboxylase biotin carboxylase subunit n=1 Tax=Pseudonocardia spinosispora TaxID=103441 RepID=UPI000419421B|nr:acetyl-CoA carboxylase biotin carboxylase subunit [Pseudonocardia spinosispora]